MKISKIAFVRRVEHKKADDSAIQIFVKQVVSKLTEHKVTPKIFSVDEFDNGTEKQDELLTFQPDLICVLGGDGTFIRVVREVIDLKTPFLGVNFGHRGFLLPFEPNDLQPYLHDLLSGKEPRFEERRALQATLLSKGQKQSFVCVNECVVKGQIGVVDVEVLVDGKAYLSCSGDGVLVATPSGSTAYNLAAGGAVIAPSEKHLAITPICCYGSIERTVGDDREITIRVKQAADAVFVPDGRVAISISQEDSIRVVTHPVVFRNIVPDGYEWYHHIQEKLGVVKV